MLFLLPYIDNRPTEGDIRSALSQNDDDLEGDTVGEPPALPQSIDVKNNQTCMNCTADCDKALLETSNGTRDGDTNFDPSLQKKNWALKIILRYGVNRIYPIILIFSD